MGDAQHVTLPTQGFQLLANDFGNGSANPRVDLVENQRRHRGRPARNHLNREADAGQFSPEATLARARGSAPGLVATRNSTCSFPATLPSGKSERSSTSNRPPDIASSFIAAFTSRQSLVAALLRSAESRAASSS